MSVAGRYGSVGVGHVTPAARDSRWPVRVAREAPLAQQRPRAGAQRAALVGIEQLAQRLRHRAVDEPAQIGQRRLRHRLAGEVPDHRAQLGLDVEAEAVVDGVDRAVRPAGSDRSCGRRCWRSDRSAHMRWSGPRCSGVLAQREVVLLEVGVDEELERALAVGPVARESSAGPAPSRAPPRGARRRARAGRVRAGSPTAAARRARACRRPAVVTPSSTASTSSVALLLPAAGPCTVRSPRVRTSSGSIAAITRGHHVTVAARADVAVGSLGSPHIGQVGRPARCSACACSTNAAACARVMAKRGRWPPRPAVSCSSFHRSLATTTMRSRRLVVADAERADGPGRFDRLEERSRCRRRPAIAAGQARRAARTGTRRARRTCSFSHLSVTSVPPSRACR